MNEPFACPIDGGKPGARKFSEGRRAGRVSIAVTGASSPIGRRLISRLCSRWMKDRFTIRIISRTDRSDRFFQRFDARIYQADLRRPGVAEWFVDSIDYLLHLARARSEIAGSDAIEMTRTLLEAASSAGARRVISLCSAPVSKTPKILDEDDDGDDWPSKKIARARREEARMALKFDRADGGRMRVNLIRPGFIYDIDDPLTRSIFARIARSERILYGAGSNLIDPIHLDDFVEGVLKALESDLGGMTFNLSGGAPIETRRFVSIIAGLTNSKIARAGKFARAAQTAARTFFGARFAAENFLSASERALYEVSRAYSIDRARARLGFNPTIKFEDGARHIVGQLEERSNSRSEL